MDQVRIKTNECNDEGHNRWLKVQFTNGINDKMMTVERIKELTTMQIPVQLPVNTCFIGQLELTCRKQKKQCKQTYKKKKDFDMGKHKLKKII